MYERERERERERVVPEAKHDQHRGREGAKGKGWRFKTIT